MKIVGITEKDLEYNINLVDKTVAEFERIDSSFEISATVCKLLLNNTVCYREITHKGRVNQCSKIHYCLLLRNCLRP